MSRKSRPRVKSTRKKRTVSKPAPRSIKIKTQRPDALDTFIVAAAKTLDLPTRKIWLPAVKSNLRVTLQLAATVSAFELPDDAEPAPVFRA